MNTRDRKPLRARPNCEPLDERVVPVVSFGNFQTAGLSFVTTALGAPTSGVLTPRNTVPSPAVSSFTFASLPSFAGFSPAPGGGSLQPVANFSGTNFTPLPSFPTFSPLPSFPTFSPLASFPTFSPLPSFPTFSPFLSTSALGNRPSFGTFNPAPTVGPSAVTLNSGATTSAVVVPSIVSAGPFRAPVTAGTGVLTTNPSITTTPFIATTPTVATSTTITLTPRTTTPPSFSAVPVGTLGSTIRTSNFPNVATGLTVPAGILGLSSAVGRTVTTPTTTLISTPILTIPGTTTVTTSTTTPVTTGPLARVGGALASLYNLTTAGTTTGSAYTALTNVLRVQGNLVRIDVHPVRGTNPAGALEGLGMQIQSTDPNTGTIEGFFPIAQLPALGGLANVASINPVLAPVFG